MRLVLLQHITLTFKVGVVFNVSIRFISRVCIKFEIEILSCGKRVFFTVVEPNTTVNGVTLASNDFPIVSWDTFCRIRFITR